MKGEKAHAGRARHRVGRRGFRLCGAARRVALMCALLAAAGVAGLTGCQTQQARRRGIRPVQVTDIGGYVEFVTTKREREQESKVREARIGFEETLFEENIRLEVDGFAYHPNLMEFSLGGLFGLLQHQAEEVFGETTESSGEDGNVLEFDLSADFLKKKRYPGSVYARRYRAIEPRPFLPSLEVTTTNYGVQWRYVSEKTPTSFLFNHSDVELDPLGRDSADQIEEGRQRNTVFRLETAYRFSPQNVLSFIYNREAVEEEPFGLSYDSDELTLTHVLRFGDAARHRLESELNLLDQRGTFDIERFRWRELLRLQHTETLRTWYHLEVLDRTQGSIVGVPPIDQQSLFVSAALEHRLFRSLVSRFTAFGQTQEFQRGLQSDRFGGQASFTYKKTNPWGVLRVGYQAGFQREDRSGGDQRGEVIDERHTLRDPEPARLANPIVDTGSIVITAEDGFTFYQEGRDYTIRTVGDFVEIRRVPTGRIADGETVLVDYVFDLGGTFTLDTTNQSFEIRQDFKFGLSPYYHLRRLDQTISPETATGRTPEDLTANILGVEFRRWNLRLVAEYEDHDSTIDPFEAVRLSADYTRQFKFGATASAAVRWTDIDFRAPIDRETTFLIVEGRYRHPITAHLTVEAAALFRSEDDSVSGQADGVDVELSLDWLVRKTEIRVTYEFGEFEDEFRQADHSAFYLQVRRNF